MYGVPMPTEADGYRLHTALYDAEMAGRLYFAMRGIRYGLQRSAEMCCAPAQ